MKKELGTSIKPVTPTPTKTDRPQRAKKAGPAGPRIGVRVSVAGGLQNAFPNAAAAGCDCIQIFVKNQRQWRAKRLGARVDRHAHIGKGLIGKSGFANFLNDARFRGVPFILETPKEKDEKGRDMDRVNVRQLRRLVR